MDSLKEIIYSLSQNQQKIEEGRLAKILGGVSLLAALAGVNASIESDPTMQALEDAYEQAEIKGDEVKMKELKDKIAEGNAELSKLYDKKEALSTADNTVTTVIMIGMVPTPITVDKADLAAAKTAWKDKVKQIRDLEANLEKAKDDKWQGERDAYETKQAAISNNLSKIEIVPNPQLLNAPEAMTEENDLNNPNTFDERFRIYTFDDKSFFDRVREMFG